MMKRRAVILLASLFLLLTAAVSFAETAGDTGMGILLNGTFNGPVSVSVSSPQFSSLAEFSGDRLERLNKLLKHFSLCVSMDGAASRTEVLIDEDPAYSVTEVSEDQKQYSGYSFDTESLFIKDADQDEESGFLRFLEDHFYFINRELDDLYPLFGKTADVFGEYARSQAENLNYKEYGKAVRRVTIPIPAAYVTENFPKVLADLAETEECRRFVNRLVFSGAQKIILLYNQDNQILRVNYDGSVGFSEQTLRKVSMVWRSLRTENTIRDKVTLKTPSIKGYDKYNLTYIRELDLSGSGRQEVTWDFQLDMKNGDQKSKIQYNAQLTDENDELTGEIVYTERKNGTDELTKMIPALRKENNGSLGGTLEITQKTGKITVSAIAASLSVSRCDSLTVPVAPTATETDLRGENGTEAALDLRNRIAGILFRKLALLPETDLEFLRQDIPEDVWTSIVESIH